MMSSHQASFRQGVKRNRSRHVNTPYNMSSSSYVSPADENVATQSDMVSFPSVINSGHQCHDFQQPTSYQAPQYAPPYQGSQNSFVNSNQCNTPSDYIKQYAPPSQVIDLYSFPKIIDSPQQPINVNQSSLNSQNNLHESSIKTVTLDEILYSGNDQAYGQPIQQIQNNPPHFPSNIQSNSFNMQQNIEIPIEEFVPAKNVQVEHKASPNITNVEISKPVHKFVTSFAKLEGDEKANKYNSSIQSEIKKPVQKEIARNDKVQASKRSFAAIFAEEQAKNKNNKQAIQMQVKQLSATPKTMSFDEIIREEAEKQQGNKNTYQYDHDTVEHEEQFWA